MKPSEMKIGSFYKWREPVPVPAPWREHVFEYLGKYAGNYLARYTDCSEIWPNLGINPGIWSIAESYDCTEVNRDGTPIAPEPAPGQVWLNPAGKEVVLTVSRTPDGRTVYGGVWCGSGFGSLEEYIEKHRLTYVRTLPNT